MVDDKGGTSVFNKFVADVIIKVLEDPEVQKFIQNLLSSTIKEQILPLLPVAISAAVDAVVNKVEGLEIVGDVVDVANNVRETLNKIIPDFDTGNKAIDDFIDIWRPK